jgi:predicted nucleotide-binding protein (sugar kinase/HSP70/actin superfamily)
MIQMTTPRARQISPSHPLFGKKTYIPRMAAGTFRALAAVLRSLGVDAEVVPPANTRTLELGGKHCAGDECYPLKVVMGDFLRIVESPGFDASRTAFFFLTGQGPCRFGQYIEYMRAVLKKLGHSQITLFHPSCEQGYSDFGEILGDFTRGTWRAILAADILFKLLLKTRPYEITCGSTEVIYEECVADLCDALETPFPSQHEQLEAVRAILLRARTRFREIPVHFDATKPLIGVVGEIFCRLNEFSNNELVRRLEEAGAEVWMNDVAEWIWYVNNDQFRKLKLEERSFSWEAIGARARNHIQHNDEHALLSLFREDFRGYEEPHDVRDVLEFAEPYLPAFGVNGEMVINVGKAVYFARKGLDGVIDISPFTCMNGIVGEAIYPRVSRDNAGIPIRNFYFDGTHSDLDRDIGIFLELAKSYQRTKPWPRQMANAAAG